MQQINGIAIANTTTLVAAPIATVAGAALTHRGLKSHKSFMGSTSKSGSSLSGSWSYRRCHEVPQVPVVPVGVERMPSERDAKNLISDVSCHSDLLSNRWRQNQNWQQHDGSMQIRTGPMAMLGLLSANCG